MMNTSGLLLCLAFCFYNVLGYADTKESRNDPNARAAGEVRNKRQSQPEEEKRIVCYYGYWATYRQEPTRFTPVNIDPNLCTHVLYGYARPDRQEGIVSNEFKIDIEDKGWEEFVGLKKSNPNLKVMLSVGGLLEGSQRFSPIAADPKDRQVFVRGAGSLLRENGFDGLDMSWLYPGFSTDSSSSDKKNYALLLKELREELRGDFIVSITVPPLDSLIDFGYDIPEILKYVDFLNVWAGAYHESTDPTANHPSPLYSLPNDPTNKDANIDTTMRSYIRRGVPPSMITMVMALYGLYYELADPTQTDIGAPTEDEAENQEWRGGLVYNELCQKLRRENWTVKRVNRTALGPYAYKGKQWVAYDDEDMIRTKASYATQMKLGGLGFWTIDQDDFKGSCHLVPFPLVRAGRQVFLTKPSVPDSLGDRTVFHNSEKGTN